MRSRIALAVVLLWASGSSAATATPVRFPSPDAAVVALVQAVRASDTATLLRILGPDARALIASGDEVADRQSRERFVRAYDEAHRLAEVDAGYARPHGRQGRVAVADSAGQGCRRLVVRHRRGPGGDPQPAHRAERAQRDPGVPRLRRRAARVLPPRSRQGHAAPVRAAGRQHVRASATGSTGRRSPARPPSPLGPLVAQAQAEGYLAKRSAARASPTGATITGSSRRRASTRRAAPTTTSRRGT